MYRQLAQTHRHEPQMDPTFWNRTANIWAGGMARSRANLLQLAATFHGKCASAAVVVVLLLGLQVLPTPTRPSAPADAEYTAPIQSNTSTQAATLSTSNSTNKAVTSKTAISDLQEDAPAAPTQPTSEIPIQQPTASTPATTPAPTEPHTETPPSDKFVSVSVLADEEPLVSVFLPGVSVKIL